MRRISGALKYIVASCLLCSASLAAHAADNVTLRLKWFNQAQFAGYYTAKEKNFYKDAGLDVAVQPGGPDFPAVQMIAGGSEQFGVTSADQILVARGKGVPVVAVAVLYRKNPFVLFSLKPAGIETPAQFRNRKIGVKLGGNEELIYRAVMKKAGLEARDVSEQPVKFDMTPLLTGQIDVWPGYVINEVITARESGAEVNIIWPGNFGINLYADTLFTTEAMIKEKPDLVRRFVAATLKGWNYAATHPEEAAQITVKTGDKLTYSHELAMMKESIPLLKPDDQPIGSMQLAQWSSMQELLLQGGFLKTRLPLEKAFTTQFLTP